MSEAKEPTGSHRIALARPNGVHAGEVDPSGVDVQALEQAIIKRLWGSVPGWLKGAGIAVGVLGGGGIGLSQYVPFTVASIWEGKSEADAAHAMLQGQIDKLAKELPSSVADELDRRVAAKAEATRLEAAQRRRGRR